MVYLAELSVVMTNRLKIVRIRARNVYHVPFTRTQALRRWRISRFRKATVLCSRCARVPSCWSARVPSCWNTRKSSWDNLYKCTCLAVASKQESRHDNMPSSLSHQIWAIWL